MICIHILAHVGQWPKTQAIQRIVKIVVYSGAVIDSVRITYKMKSGETKTVHHGGNAGQESLSIDLAGNLYFIFCGFSKLLTQWHPELQNAKNSSLFMVAGSTTRLLTARNGMCPGYCHHFYLN